jgi:hypothetical protein
MRGRIQVAGLVPGDLLRGVPEQCRICFSMRLSVVITPVTSLPPRVHRTDALRVTGFINTTSSYIGTSTNTSLLGRRYF